MIVAAVDRSEQASRVAAEAKELADSFDEPLHLVHVLSSEEFGDIEMDSVDKTGQAMDPDEVEKIASEIAADSASESYEYTAVGLIGDVSAKIIGYAAEHDARYIVMGGRKRSPIGKAIFGSVTQSVLLNANRPVLTVVN